MAHVILATDLSDDAMHAAEYAIKLFGATGNTYTLLTTYFDASMAEPVGPLVTEAIHEAADVGSAHFAKELKARTSVHGLHREVVFAVEVAAAVNIIASEKGADMVVVGNRGKSGATWFGSNTLSMIKHSQVPVLAVPKSAPLQQPQRILLADDMVDALPRGLTPLRLLALRTNAKVMIGHVHEQVMAGASHPSDSAPDLALAGVEHSTYHITGDLLEGLRILASKHRVDMVAVLHRHMDLITRLFHPSVTKQLALEVELPLLVLQEAR